VPYTKVNKIGRKQEILDVKDKKTRERQTTYREKSKLRKEGEKWRKRPIQEYYQNSAQTALQHKNAKATATTTGNMEEKRLKKEKGESSRYDRLEYTWLSQSYLECHLSSKDEFVFFKKTSSRVDKHWVCNAINQVDDASFDFFSWLCTIDSCIEHYTECLEQNKTPCWLWRTNQIYN